MGGASALTRGARALSVHCNAPRRGMALLSMFGREPQPEASMSLLSMFTRKKPGENRSEPPSGGQVVQDPTLPLHRIAGEPPAVSSRRTERTARRELLYTVVRECMNRAGVLSASYKF